MSNKFEILENFLYYLQDKVCDCYKIETSNAIENFLIEFKNKKD